MKQPMQEIDEVDISIVIVSWNAQRYLRECLESFASQKSKHSREIIVVDNASTDGSPQYVIEHYPGVILIENEKNDGFAKGNNIGIKKSKGRYLCLVNSDVKVLSGCLDKLCEYMDRQPTIGVIGPKILWPDMTLQDSCRKFPSLWNNFCASAGLNRIFAKIPMFSGEHMTYFDHNSIKSVDSLVGCFLMVRQDALNEVGLLDERFFMYAEEVDWCKRFRKAGWKVVFYPEAKVIHYGRGSSSNEPLRFALEQKRSILLYWQKHHSWATQKLIILIYFVHHVTLSLINTVRYSVQKTKKAGFDDYHNKCAKFFVKELFRS
jgi:GT2 family glycosyltransferase